MSITVHQPQTRDEVQRRFDQLLRDQQARASLISTKAEEAERQRNRELVERSSAYTVESIVNGLARLQLHFGRAVDEIAEELDGESSKLGELRRAIEVERGRLDQLQSTVVAAEALAILEQDHRQALAALDERAQQGHAQLGEQTTTTRERWQREDEALAQGERERSEALAKARQEAAADRAYEQARVDRLDADERATRRRELERQLADEDAAKVKDWTAREKLLDEHAEKLAALRAQVGGFEEELAKLTRDAREKAIASVHREAKFELEMLGKEHAGNVKVFELKVRTLEERIASQADLIVDLSAKLDTTIAKSQSLAEQAFRRPTA